MWRQFPRSSRCLRLSQTTIVDSIPITRSEMHQTKKGNDWHFGMKAHIGVDSRHKLIHSVAATAANVHDSHLLPALLHGGETKVWGDPAYQGKREVVHPLAPWLKT